MLQTIRIYIIMNLIKEEEELNLVGTDVAPKAEAPPVENADAARKSSPNDGKEDSVDDELIIQELKLKNANLQAVNQDLYFELEATLVEKEELLRLLGEWYHEWLNSFSHIARPMTPELEASFGDVSRDDDDDAQEYLRAFELLRLRVERDHQGQEQLNFITDEDHEYENVRHHKKPTLTK